MKRRVLDLPLPDRPREKAIRQGLANLASSDLISILLGSGTTKHPITNLASQILKQFPLDTWPSLTLDKLIKLEGIGTSKALQILATIELGQRIFATPQTQDVIENAIDALPYLRDISTKQQEHLVVLYLNSRYQLIKRETVGIGTININIVEPRDILSLGLQLPCRYILLAHNHPSGDPQPSVADIKFTIKIQKAAELLGLVLHDHVIICSKTYFSFHDNKVDSVGFAPTSPPM